MVKAKQQGPGARKYACGKCGVLRWTEQFGGVSVTNLNPSSVCDLCKMEVSFSKQFEELRAHFLSQVSDLQNRYEARLSKLEEENRSLRIGGSSVISAPVMEQAEKKKNKKKRKKKKKNNKGEDTLRNRQTEDSQKVGKKEKNRQIEEKKVSKKKKKKNRKSRVEDRKEMTGRAETTPKVVVKVFGDSLVRGLAGPLTGPKRSASVACLPGKGNLHIRKEVEKSLLKKEEVAVIAVSGNDLYKRDRSVGSTEKIISDVMGAVDDAKLKTKRVVVVGMLPRRGYSDAAYSKNVGINNRIRDLCIPEGVLFTDPYSAFYGMGDLFARDGVHQNVKGRDKLVDVIRDACDRMVRLTTIVDPNRSFASVARTVEEKPRSGNGLC